MAAAVLISVVGCDRGGTPEQPDQKGLPAEQDKPKLAFLVAGWQSWSHDEALARLGDEQAGISAAVRLVRLAEAEPLCAPAELTDASAGRLRLTRLSDSVWALGLVDGRSERVLHAPVLIGTDGQVETVASGVEEELLTLHVSEDADVFPHLLITPRRVLLAQLPLEAGIELKSPATVGFAAREQEGYSYVGLMLRRAGVWAEVARYLWQPYELGLAGPAMDALPDPPGGKFQMDMQASPLLIPVGGEIPEPEPLNNKPPPRMEFEVGEEDA